MGASNHTAKIRLSQFVGDDKPTWLGDYNDDMRKIDDFLSTIKDNNTTIVALSHQIQALQTQINSLDSRLKVVEEHK